jgi:hypothetical protein
MPTLAAERNLELLQNKDMEFELLFILILAQLPSYCSPKRGFWRAR